jgi:hypothetical protein
MKKGPAQGWPSLRQRKRHRWCRFHTVKFHTGETSTFRVLTAEDSTRAQFYKLEDVVNLTHILCFDLINAPSPIGLV